MKKVLLGMSVAAALLASGSVLAADPAGTDYSHIKINGEVTSGTCEIDVNGGAAVQLESVVAKDMVANNTVYNAQDFVIKFSKCPVDLTKGTIAFADQDPGIDAATGYLFNSNTGTDAAQSVEIALETADTNTLLNLVSDTVDVTLKDGAGNVSLQAGYITAGGTVAPGIVNSTVSFSVDYI